MSTNEKTDWSAYTAKFGRRNTTEFAKQQIHESTPQHPLSESQLGSGATNGGEVALASREDLGTFTRFKANRLADDAALTQYKETLIAQVEVTRHYLSCLVGAKKAKIDVELKEYVAVLEGVHLRQTSEFDVKLFEERGDVLKQLTNAYLNQVRDIMQNDWPEDEMDLMVEDLREMRMGVRATIKENFASRYQKPVTL